MTACALLIDFDGVIRHFPRLSELERAAGLPDGAVHAAAFAPERVGAAVRGTVSDDQWRAQVALDLAQRFPGARADEAVRGWSESAGELDSAVLALVAQARRHVRVVLVTNATTRLGSDLARLGLTQAFDAVVSSAEVGTAKPDAGIFHAALARAQAEAGHALFVDDALRNVAAARALGIDSLHFTGIEPLRNALGAFLSASSKLERADPRDG